MKKSWKSSSSLEEEYVSCFSLNIWVNFKIYEVWCNQFKMKQLKKIVIATKGHSLTIKRIMHAVRNGTCNLKFSKEVNVLTWIHWDCIHFIAELSWVVLKCAYAMYVHVFSLAQIYWKWTELAQGMRYSFLLIYIPQNLKAAKTQAIAHLHLEIVCVKNSMFPLLFCFN